ncbi:MAG: GNAT family N-acetyltransferase [Ruminococcaceae bacterium]|nr:GNAT family N-acetyltransferase [Oscillospiraceae bacterium]
MNIEIVEAYAYKDQVKTLFQKYTDMLIECDKDFKEYLNKQNYDDEIAHLEEKYGLPYGRLYLAFCDNNPAGCIALRKLDNENCELKRLYVKSEYRGKNIGSHLVKHIIKDAKEIGYKHILLDTLPFLETAISMYKRYGFYEIESYNNTPMDNLIYLKYDL